MGVIVNGKYYPDASKAPRAFRTSSVAADIHRQHNLERDAETYAQDLIQPYNPDGSINENFIEYHGDSEQGKYLKEKLCQSKENN